MELQLDESRVSGARYLTVKPVSYTPNWNNQTWIKMTEWCTNTYGPTPEDGVWSPGARWYSNNRKFWFRNKADRTMFILRWS